MNTPTKLKIAKVSIFWVRLASFGQIGLGENAYIRVKLTRFYIAETRLFKYIENFTTKKKKKKKWKLSDENVW